MNVESLVKYQPFPEAGQNRELLELHSKITDRVNRCFLESEIASFNIDYIAPSVQSDLLKSFKEIQSEWRVIFKERPNGLINVTVTKDEDSALMVQSPLIAQPLGAQQGSAAGQYVIVNNINIIIQDSELRQMAQHGLTPQEILNIQQQAQEYGRIFGQELANSIGNNHGSNANATSAEEKAIDLVIDRNIGLQEDMHPNVRQFFKNQLAEGLKKARNAH